MENVQNECGVEPENIPKSRGNDPEPDRNKIRKKIFRWRPLDALIERCYRFNIRQTPTLSLKGMPNVLTFWKSANIVKNLVDVDVKIEQVRQIIASGKASFESMTELDSLIEQRRVLIAGMASGQSSGVGTASKAKNSQRPGRE